MLQFRSKRGNCPKTFERGCIKRREEREIDNPGKFSVLVCLPAGMWALSLRPPEPWRRRERTNACAIRGPEHGEHRNRRTCYQRNGGCRAGPIIISTRNQAELRSLETRPRLALNFSLGQCLSNKRGFRSRISPVVSSKNRSANEVGCEVYCCG